MKLRRSIRKPSGRAARTDSPLGHWRTEFRRRSGRVQSNGYEEAFSDLSPRGVRIAYFDTTRDLPGMLEVIEMTAGVEEQYRYMYQAAKDRDGRYVVIQLEPKASFL